MEDWPSLRIPVPPWLFEAAQKNLRKQNPRPEIRAAVANAWKNGGVIDMSWAGTPANKQAAVDARLDELMKKVEAPKKVETPKIVARDLAVYWPSIDELVENPVAVARKFMADRLSVWYRQEYAPDGMILDKTLEQVETFLEDIIFREMQWLDLSEPHQRNWLQLLRRVHKNWWRSTNG